ncbi:MAG: D-alanine--D-alanine ligase [Planctomycetota bacterium]|jgi:D-alanine-D-alanine ligase|nr:D-alanine--D-alanine ligase [Planctomycetota bacterium]
MTPGLRVGITYDLREFYLAKGYSPEAVAEFDKPGTVAGIEAALLSLECQVERIGNLEALVQRLARGESWDLVFNIAEGLYGYAREAQVPALLEGYAIPCVFSDAFTLALCLHKAFTKSVIRDAGLPTPAFRIFPSPGWELESAGLTYPLFIKPVGEGTGKGVSGRGKISEAAALGPAVRELAQRFSQPVLVEEFLPGREFTVGIVGSGEKARVLGVMEVILLPNAEPEVYSFENKDQYLDRVEYRLASDSTALAAGETALASYRLLGCRDGGRVDLRSDREGVPNFMEINPLAGLDPVHSDLPIICRLQGIAYQELIGWIVESASERLPERKKGQGSQVS